MKLNDSVCFLLYNAVRCGIVCAMLLNLVFGYSRDWSGYAELSGGTLAAVYPLHTSSLLFLLGGGVSPLYPPNKVILWDDALGRDVVELEFRERVRGIACRRGWLVVVLRRRAVVFKVLKGERDGVVRVGEYTTGDNTRGMSFQLCKVL